MCIRDRIIVVMVSHLIEIRDVNSETALSVGKCLFSIVRRNISINGKGDQCLSHTLFERFIDLFSYFPLIEDYTG